MDTNRKQTESDNLYDAVIIGGGPAGLTAALYLARARYRVLVVEKEKLGGQITITSEVVNYPGIIRTNGSELTGEIQKQAAGFGAEFMLAEVNGLELGSDVKTVRTDKGSLTCFGVLIATGAHPRTVGFPGEERFKGHGVAYCATCDGEFFTGMEIFVVGGGFAAAEESVFLTKYASHVTILIREEDFTCAKAVADSARANEKITVLTNTEVEELDGDSVPRKLRYRNNVTGDITEYEAAPGKTFGVFVFAGYAPATELVKDIVELNEHGYIITDLAQKTNFDGVYAAGDVCVKNLRQVVTAVGDGALAATELERYAAKMQKKTGLRPRMVQTAAEEDRSKPSSQLFDSEMLSQLHTVFAKMQTPLTLKLSLDERPVSSELLAYIKEIVSLTDKLDMEILNETSDTDIPCVRVFRQDGSDSGLSFHGVPGGHEFTSFILGLYNVAGPGQEIDAALREKIHGIQRDIHMQVMVSLSCTMCPELVTAAQKIAAENPRIRADVYDLNHFPEMKEKYQVMSVPCLVYDGKLSFGKKNLSQLLDLLTETGQA